MPRRVLYHASPQGDIDVFEPRRESTPSIERGLSPPRVYATDHPAYAAAHGFRWGTSEGFDLGFITDETGKESVRFIVPRHAQHRLNQPVHLYILNSDVFELLEHVEPRGHNYAAVCAVKPLEKISFETVRSAIEFYGGSVEITK